MAGRDAPTISSAQRDSGLITIQISGELDSLGTRQISADFAAAIPDRMSRVVIDLSGIVFLTSAALAMFVMHAKALSQGGGSLHFAGANNLVADTFKQAGFSTLFPIYPSLEDAVAHLEGD